MTEIFLSASVPLPDRDRRFFDTANVLAIREAIKALVEVALPSNRITCGGHPAITPLLSLFASEAAVSNDTITIYQSAFFSEQMPTANADFVDVKIVPAIAGDRVASLTAMRRQMIASRDFAVAVFIGGMEGLLEEFAIFVDEHPNGVVLPLASTGAAAAIIYDQGIYDDQLARELTFSSLFRRRLPLD